MTSVENETVERAKGPTPAYAPFATLKNFIGQMKERGVPPQIDKSLMSNLSGSAQSVLLASLRSLQLIGADGGTLPDLERLVAAYETDAWPGVLGEVVDIAYADVLSGFDLTTATRKMLEERFADVGPSIREKAIRFLLAVLDEVGKPISKHLKAATPKNGRGRGRRKTRGTRRTSSSSTAGETEVSHVDAKKFTFPLRQDFEAVLYLPNDVQSADVDRLVQYLKILPFDGGKE